MIFQRNAAAQPPEEAQESRPTWVESLYDWAEAALVALVVVVVLFAFVFRVVSVDGDSMLPNLETGDRLLLNCINYTPERGDIVVVNRYTKEPLVKRIIAVEGDIIDIKDGLVYLNGVALDETFLDPNNAVTPSKEFVGPAQVPAGHVFVIGDNRSDSHDSRYADIGFVSVKDIVGVAVFRIWPFNRLGVPT